MSISIGGKNFKNAIINGQDTDIEFAPPMSNTRMFLSPPLVWKIILWAKLAKTTQIWQSINLQITTICN
jgi:hypothetical protein